MDVHIEEYEVTSNPVELSSPTRLYFTVKKKNTSGDNPVEEFYLRKRSSGSTRTGFEDLEDVTARVDLTTNDYADAKDDIKFGDFVSYLSTRQVGIEKISQFTWS